MIEKKEMDICKKVWASPLLSVKCAFKMDHKCVLPFSSTVTFTISYYIPGSSVWHGRM